jgi:hypothetical protein
VLLFLAYCFASSVPLTTNDDEMGASLGLQALRRSGFFRLVIWLQRLTRRGASF